MSWKDHSRANMAVQAMVNILDSEGLDPMLCLQGTDLTIAQILDVETKIPDELEIQVIEQALSLLPKKAGYGAKAGQALRITNFGIWGLAILTSPDVRSAFETMSRFSEMSIVLSKVSLRETHDQVAFVLDMSHLPVRIHNFMFERYYVMTVNFLREMVPEYDFSDFELHLPASDPVYEQELAALTKLKVVPGQFHYAVVASKTLLDYPFPKTDPLAHAHFMSECEGMLKAHKQLPDYAQSIRNYILQKQDFSPKLSVVAQSMCISERTLKRRLLEENHSFSQVVLDTKMTLAKELLLTAALPVKVVDRKSVV